MHKTGAQLVRYALEQLSIKNTFGIVGLHNRELYNELNESGSITPHLVNQELSAAFMADAISRTSSPGEIGAILITADAIISQGIAEAFISGIPLLIIAGGPLANTPTNGIDQQQLLQPVTKACFKITQLEDVVSTIFEAQQIAISDKPGPVFVEIPIDVQLHTEDLDKPLPVHLSAANQAELDQQQIDATARRLLNAQSPSLLLGWDAVQARTDLAALAELLAAPVCTNLEGNSAFPTDHMLHAGLLFNPSAQRVLKDCDCLLTIGIKNSDLEVAPEQIIELQPQAIPAMVYKLKELKAQQPQTDPKQTKQISRDKADLKEDWLEHNSKGRVNPAVFFDALSAALDQDAIIVTGHGTHRALAAELLPINGQRMFISPTSFNAMGYCVPAVNAIKLAKPDRQVVGIVGDGAMVINGMEALTAVREKLGTVYCLFNNSERNSAKNLGHINWGSFADALECGYFPITNNKGIDIIVRRALETAAHGQPVILDICIDYSRKSFYGQQQEKAQLAQLPGRDKLGIVKRAIVRKIMGARSS